ncbi:MAG TPA: hypothetical protein VG497_01825 [Kribbella sp.]|nr:hypothetical protein [Kribbella sp.]
MELVGGEDVDADRQVARLGVVEGGAEFGADTGFGEWLVEDLPGAAVQPFEVQVEAVDPAVADLHRGEMPETGCAQQRRVDSPQRGLVQH